MSYCATDATRRTVAFKDCSLRPWQLTYVYFVLFGPLHCGKDRYDKEKTFFLFFGLKVILAS